MKPIVLLDCDGPLSNFTQAYLEALEIETNCVHSADEVDQWAIHECAFFDRAAKKAGLAGASELRRRVDAHVSKPGFCENIFVQPKAKEAVERLLEIAEIYVVTSPWNSPTWMYERMHWVHKHFGIPTNQVIQTGRKHLIRGDVFVDDKPSHVIEWQRHWPNSTAHLFDMHHNRAEAKATGIVSSDWERVIESVEAKLNATS